MVPYLGCEHAREMLQAFIDGELPVDEQVSVESHLRWCRTCAAHVEDLRTIGESLRLGGPAALSGKDDRELSVLHDAVLSRVNAEREQSFSVQVRSSFDDLHLLWAGLGAMTAVLVCLFGTMSVLHAAGDERPDSLAGVIQALATPGSDRNPMRLDAFVSVPRALDDSQDVERIRRSLNQISADEATFALAMVVTREGRIANYDLLLSERDGARRFDTAAQGRDVASLLDAVSRAQFAPAQRRVGGAPVAVNMVWLVARTTVKGSPRAIVEFRPAHEIRPAVAPPAAKPADGTINDQAGGGLPRGSAAA
jgi:hypothetical protein